MDDARDELIRLSRAVAEHLSWLDRGGVDGVPRQGTLSRPPVSPAAAHAEPLHAEAAPVETQVIEPSPPPEIAAPAPALHSPAPQSFADEEEHMPPSMPITQAAPPRPAASRSTYGDLFSAPGLTQIRDDIGDCQRCKLAPTRTQIVFGTGTPEAPVVFVGEGPGADEDRTGEPFVGKAGQLLTRMIAAMGFERSEVYICNVVKCRPPGNRPPEPDEVAACEPFLKRQIAAIRPRMIVALGKSAVQALLKTTATITSLRGNWKSYDGIPLMPTFHPSYLLRTPSAKREVWDDLQKVMAELDRLGIPRRKTPPRGGESQD